jgi:hypothetical protein
LGCFKRFRLYWAISSGVISRIRLLPKCILRVSKNLFGSRHDRNPATFLPSCYSAGKSLLSLYLSAS